MKKLTIIALTLITLGAASQIVEKNIDKEEVKTVVTTNLKEQDEKNEELYFQHDNDDKASLIEKIVFKTKKTRRDSSQRFSLSSIMGKFGLINEGKE